MSDYTKLVKIVHSRVENCTLCYLEDGRVVPFFYIGMIEEDEEKAKEGRFNWEGYATFEDMNEEDKEYIFKVNKNGTVKWSAES